MMSSPPSSPPFRVEDDRKEVARDERTRKRKRKHVFEVVRRVMPRSDKIVETVDSRHLLPVDALYRCMEIGSEETATETLRKLKPAEEKNTFYISGGIVFFREITE